MLVIKLNQTKIYVILKLGINLIMRYIIKIYLEVKIEWQFQIS